VRFREAKPASALRLFCFPYAGGGPGDFRDWSLDCPEDVELFALQLPGRGARFNEPLIARMDQLIETISDVIASQLDRPFVFFGHSMGGRIAFALAQKLKALGRPQPELLAVSASRAPGRPGQNAARLTDAAFRQYLQELGGIPPDLLNDEELMELMLPVLRADFQLNDSLNPAPIPLDCPILAWGGDSDREVTEEDLFAWRNFTNSAFEVKLFPGGHFFLRAHRQALINSLLEPLAATRLRP